MSNYKRFCRKVNKIKKEMEEVYASGLEMNVVRYILKQIETGGLDSAYRTIMVESDKLRSTKYGDIFRKYKIYEAFEDMDKRIKYRNRYWFKGNFKNGKECARFMKQHFSELKRSCD